MPGEDPILPPPGRRTMNGLPATGEGTCRSRPGGPPPTTGAARGTRPWCGNRVPSGVAPARLLRPAGHRGAPVRGHGRSGAVGVAEADRLDDVLVHGQPLGQVAAGR